ncbi:MAS20 protein import receptor-domain-containing protein [Halteromyces radiatus]|uniref:MAS20 protein import receptor-domain-containing protein n=1 Tax=Halteromyces radiatus TaxID=101107 RepID=UPI0022211B3B|nr:MAS20 protein import receptor-domain-containing protein [Halteromyces radiatus]KAI8093488.1 MAS20 protein import receptor-domain-containing protein [Halteromyces radiatus]
MPLQSKHVAYIAAGVAVTAGVGYLIYFDQKRRSDPNFRKQLKKERKKLAKKEKVEKEQAEQGIKELIDQVVAMANAETLPTSPEEKEKYFMTQVAKGEALCTQGPNYYQAAVLPFLLALKVYPTPLELIMIYQKTIPEPVFQILVTIMAKEQNNRVNAFYEQFPGAESGLTLGEIPVGKNPEGKTIIRRGLMAEKEFAEGDVLFTEVPLVSALYPNLEGVYCHHCLKFVDEQNKTGCDDCDFVIYCSKECQQQAQGYHKYLCGKNLKKKEDKTEEEQAAIGEPEDQQVPTDENETDATVVAFRDYAREHNQMYPLMIAEFLSAMVTEETERTKRGEAENNKTFTSWDHVDRFRYLDTQPTEATNQEINLLTKLLDPKVAGISEFLSNQIYLMLKGKLLYNAYAIETADNSLDIPASQEHTRATSSGKKSVGAGLYKLATYLGQSESEANSKVVFQDNNHQLTVIATKAIAKGDEIKASYTLPVPTSASTSQERQNKPEENKVETKEPTVSSDEKHQVEQETPTSLSSSAAATTKTELATEKQ